MTHALKVCPALIDNGQSCYKRALGLPFEFAPEVAEDTDGNYRLGSPGVDTARPMPHGWARASLLGDSGTRSTVRSVMQGLSDSGVDLPWNFRTS